MHSRFLIPRWLPLTASFAIPGAAHAGFNVTSATALPATVAPGQSVAIAASVQSSAAASNLVVDLEIYSSSGVKLAQTFYQGQSFTKSQNRSYSWSYKVPTGSATGKYTLKVGVFTSNWSSVIYWNDSATSFTAKTAATALNGACGSSNGAIFSAAPTNNLCTAGTASAITGTGPWRWSCVGSNGGTTASCSTSPPTSGGGGSLPAGLSGTFFVGLGVHPDQFSWVSQSGARWGMCYQYLSSGVTPGQSWATQWGTDFAYHYAVSARAAGCIPELTYYQIVPTINAEGAAAESAALKNATIMANYFRDFTVLMKQLRQFGGTAVVHVEPDMWGYFEQLGAPSSIAASVASSGVADVAAYPNTLAGFGAALLHLRDLYAPNVVMAAHASPWMWSLSTDPSLDVVSIARKDAAFLTATGNWDLFFMDVADRDAAYYQYVVGDGGAHWWDATNQKYPNFNRLNTWAAAFTSAARKRLVIWQIPVGNTVMAAMNNTHYHYQDNREQYWLQDYPNNQAISQLVQAGVIGLLFGAGNGGTTQPFDAAGDGVTNPKPINGNTRTSSYSDDDGGLLRTNVGNYYKSGAAPLK